jgi:hypothetical protein
MATALVIEEETGTSRGLYHPHNGYYAGDFSRASRSRTRSENTVYAPNEGSSRQSRLQWPAAR